MSLPLGSFIFVDSSKFQPFDQVILRQKAPQGEIFASGDGVCLMRFYYKMWGSLHMGRLQLFMVTKGKLYNSKSEVWKTRGRWKYTVYFISLIIYPPVFLVRPLDLIKLHLALDLIEFH